MKRKIIIILAILFCIMIIFGIVTSLNINKTKNNSNINMESENKMISNIKVIIDGNIYNAKLEENETAQKLAQMMPMEYNMSELNGNEKYVYLDTTLPTDMYNPKHIKKGDIMLYGDNCLVVFYKSFDTQYSYTKIGYIDNLQELENKNVIIKFEK